MFAVAFVCFGADTFDAVFRNFDMVGTTGGNKVELPLPFRLERHNFNPHQCLGNFEYDEKEKPRLLKDSRTGLRMDKNLRLVNASGWLIDSEENIIDNQGQVKFMKA